MQDRIAIHGLEPRQGQTAFAFFVLRLARPMERAALVEAVRHVAPMIPDADRIIDAFSEDMTEQMQLIGLPWLPPGRDELDEQRALIESAAARGVEEAWFFQTGTALPAMGGEDGDADDADADDADADDEDADDEDADDEDADDEDAGDADADYADDDDDDDGDEDDGGDDAQAAWSHGPPPQQFAVPFPVDGYPEILDEIELDDFGIAFRLAGPFTPGESTVLLGFHALWLAPYGAERYRNTSVTIDRRHHAALLWVDRFSVPSPPEVQVGHLLWVLSKLHEVTPVLHARFGGATMAQKYGRVVGDTSEPFVLGGNPLLGIYREGGAAGVDRWIAAQADWSSEEVARMLRELAEQIVERGEAEETDADDDDGADDADGADLSDGEEDEGYADDEIEDEADEADEADDDETGDDDEGADDDEAAEGRHITASGGELLIARARAGLLDARAADALRPLLAIATPEQGERRRITAIEILGALRDRASVPAMIQILEAPPSQGSLDPTGREDLLAATASALGAIADPAAVPALTQLIATPGPHQDRTRAAAAAALAACRSSAPAPAPRGGDHETN
jgi:hypothetical protein